MLHCKGWSKVADLCDGNSGINLWIQVGLNLIAELLARGSFSIHQAMAEE
jgi:hypothetical protein